MGDVVVEPARDLLDCFTDSTIQAIRWDLDQWDLVLDLDYLMATGSFCRAILVFVSAGLAEIELRYRVPPDGLCYSGGPVIIEIAPRKRERPPGGAKQHEYVIHTHPASHLRVTAIEAWLVRPRAPAPWDGRELSPADRRRMVTAEELYEAYRHARQGRE